MDNLTLEELSQEVPNFRHFADLPELAPYILSVASNRWSFSKVEGLYLAEYMDVAELVYAPRLGLILYRVGTLYQQTDAFNALNPRQRVVILSRIADRASATMPNRFVCNGPINDLLKVLSNGNRVQITDRLYRNTHRCIFCGTLDNTEEHEIGRICEQCMDRYMTLCCSSCGHVVEMETLAQNMNFNESGEYVCPRCNSYSVEIHPPFVQTVCDMRIPFNHTVMHSTEQSSKTQMNRCIDCGKPTKNEKCSLCASWPGHIVCWHSGLGREDRSEGDRYKIGFEIEKEDYNIRRTPSKQLKKLLSWDGWIMETDSSLDEDSGFELVSPVFGLSNKELLRSNLMKVERYIKAKDSNRCGGHIHLSDTRRTPAQILKAISGYLPLLYSMYPSRTRNFYCVAKPQNKYRSEYNLSNHYQALNIKEHTLEFRIFPTPRSVNQLMFRANLIHYMITNPDKDFGRVVRMMGDPNTDLYKLLRTVISPAKIRERVAEFVRFAEIYEGVRVVSTADGDIKNESVGYYPAKVLAEFTEDDFIQLISQCNRRNNGITMMLSDMGFTPKALQVEARRRGLYDSLRPYITNIAESMDDDGSCDSCDDAFEF